MENEWQQIVEVFVAAEKGRSGHGPHSIGVSAFSATRSLSPRSTALQLPRLHPPPTATTPLHLEEHHLFLFSVEVCVQYIFYFVLTFLCGEIQGFGFPLVFVMVPNVCGAVGGIHLKCVEDARRTLRGEELELRHWR